jgi:hypothetical protein
MSVCCLYEDIYNAMIVYIMYENVYGVYGHDIYLFSNVLIHEYTHGYIYTLVGIYIFDQFTIVEPIEAYV